MKMTKKQKLTRSIMRVFGCNYSTALDWAEEGIKSESEPNGRLGSFKEFTESKTIKNSDLSERVKGLQRARAGIKRNFREPTNETFFKRVKARARC